MQQAISEAGLPKSAPEREKIRFIDLFCGIGGFRFALESVAEKRFLNAECVFSSDIDKACQKAYAANFGELPLGDITKISADAVPDHDILLAGFPCQPFSIIGQRRGFEDTRGNLFFDIARILEAKKPAAFVLENVKLLVGHNGGKTLKKIWATTRNTECSMRLISVYPKSAKESGLLDFVTGIIFHGLRAGCQ